MYLVSSAKPVNLTVVSYLESFEPACRPGDIATWPGIRVREALHCVPKVISTFICTAIAVFGRGREFPLLYSINYDLLEFSLRRANHLYVVHATLVVDCRHYRDATVY